MLFFIKLAAMQQAFQKVNCAISFCGVSARTVIRHSLFMQQRKVRIS